MENLIKIGSIENSWSWEYDSSVITATLLFNIDGGELVLDLIKVHTKTGLGRGRFENHIGTFPVGTLRNPLKGQINNILKNHKQTFSFQRLGWFNDDKSDMSLKTLFLETYHNNNDISRALKIASIKKKIK